MSAIPARALRAALEAKGFRVAQGDHTFYQLHVGGAKAPVWTKISHGKKFDYGDDLLHKVARQMNLTRKELNTFVSCALSYSEYVDLLLDRGAI